MHWSDKNIREIHFNPLDSKAYLTKTHLGKAYTFVFQTRILELHSWAHQVNTTWEQGLSLGRLGPPSIFGGPWAKTSFCTWIFTKQLTLGNSNFEPQLGKMLSPPKNPILTQTCYKTLLLLTFYYYILDFINNNLVEVHFLSCYRRT